FQSSFPVGRLHSFPTRRSSDLGSIVARVAFLKVLSYTHCGAAAVRRVGYTRTLKLGYFFSRPWVPSVSLSAYCATFCCVMVNRGLSLSNRSGIVAELYDASAG